MYFIPIHKYIRYLELIQIFISNNTLNLFIVHSLIQYSYK